MFPAIFCVVWQYHSKTCPAIYVGTFQPIHLHWTLSSEQHTEISIELKPLTHYILVAAVGLIDPNLTQTWHHLRDIQEFNSYWLAKIMMATNITKASRPSTYKGQRDVRILNSWIFQMERYFWWREIPEEKKAHYALTYLTHQANT